MAKQGDLWDDSALINAFDEAISKYKKMHGDGGHDSLTKGRKIISSKEENLSAVAGESHEAIRQMVADDNSNVALNTTTEIPGTNDLSQVTEICPLDSFPSEPHKGPSSIQHGEDVPQGNPNAQGSEEYTSLLNKYYELEEQRQKILQQLNQFGNWDYQGSGSNVQGASSSTSQVDQIAAYQPCYPPPFCPYGCLYVVAPCPSIPATCNTSSARCGNGKSVSSPLAKACHNSDVILDQEKEKDINIGHLAQSTSSETDFAMVMNAWYAAGFYTGKYLSEQSLAKKHHF